MDGAWLQWASVEYVGLLLLWANDEHEVYDGHEVGYDLSQISVTAMMKAGDGGG